MLRYLSALLRLELRMAEELKPSRRDAMYGKGESKSAPEGSAAEEASESPAEAAAEGDDMPARHASERAALHKKHRDERRDMHGNHRTEHDQRQERHEQEIKQMLDRHMQEASRGEAAVAGATPGGEGGAVGGAGEVPQAQAA